MKPREVKALAQVLTELMCSQTFNKMISNLCSTLSLDLTPTKYKNKIRHRKAVVRMMIIKYPYLSYSVVLVLPFPLQSLQKFCFVLYFPLNWLLNSLLPWYFSNLVWGGYEISETTHFSQDTLQCRCHFGAQCQINQVFDAAILDCNWMLDWQRFFNVSLPQSSTVTYIIRKCTLAHPKYMPALQLLLGGVPCEND